MYSNSKSGNLNVSLDSNLMKWAIQRSDTVIDRSIKSAVEIDLSDLNLDTIDELKNYTRLQDVNVSKNKISDLQFLNSLINLISLNASHNRLREVFDNQCGQSLRQVDISFNQIVHLSNFDNLQFLNEINLEQNSITNLNALQNCHRLRKLNASRNYIDSLMPLGKMGTLLHINVSYNRLSSLSGIGNATKLEYLDASHNQIDELEIFERPFICLQFTNLEFNNITEKQEIERTKHLKNMKILNVGFNQMSHVSPISLPVLKQNRHHKEIQPTPKSVLTNGNSKEKGHQKLNISQRVLLLVGPEGGGKSELAHSLTERYTDSFTIADVYTDDMLFTQSGSVSQQKENAVNTKHIKYIDSHQFKLKEENNQFICTYMLYDCNFGISVDDFLEENLKKIPIILIEMEAYHTVKNDIDQICSILVMPRSKQVLAERLKKCYSSDQRKLQRLLSRFDLYQLRLRDKTYDYQEVIKTDDEYEALRFIVPTIVQQWPHVVQVESVNNAYSRKVSQGSHFVLAHKQPDTISQTSTKPIQRPLHPRSQLSKRKSSITIALEQRVERKRISTLISKNSKELINEIESGILGRDETFSGPYGERLIIYCDYTASGKSLNFIEQFIRSNVLPKYSNTHTTNTATSLQTTSFRYEARELIGKCCNCSPDLDVVLFCGSGTTGAIHKLVHNLTLKSPPKPIVLVGPFEHHSNLIPWRYISHSIDRIGLDEKGCMDIENLEQLLKQKSQIASQENRRLICSFSAASNITGILTDTNSVSALVHRYDGLVFWDYASGAPYLPIDMNPIVEGPDQDYVYKDAVFFSVHKFIGGVQTPGVLLAKRFLLEPGECYPHGAGGGTVFYVGREKHLFLKQVEEREEGGTPEIVGSIRAGLIFQLKDAVGQQNILKREKYLETMAWSKFSKASDNLVILGGKLAPRIPIFSFLIRVSMNKIPNSQSASFLLLHHNFICCLLNDLFGIQSRSGCACAGPYGMDLMGMDENLAMEFMSCLMGSDPPESGSVFHSEREIMKPGFTRVNLAYFAPDIEIKFILDAILFVAKYGIYFLLDYNYDKQSGSWKHCIDSAGKNKVISLNDIKYESEELVTAKESLYTPKHFGEVMQIAYAKLDQLKKEALNENTGVNEPATFSETNEAGLRWFLLPSEALEIIRSVNAQAPVNLAIKSPFEPGTIAAVLVGDGHTTEHAQKKSMPHSSREREGTSPSIKDRYINAGYKDTFTNDQIIHEENN